MERKRYIYKALTPEQWAVFEGAAAFKGAPIDLADGYIHMSARGQLKETLDKWFADQVETVLLEVDTQALPVAPTWEISRGGAEFPHLYAPLPRAAISRQWVVSPVDGVYELPKALEAK